MHRARHAAPWTRFLPWTDKRGRFDALRAATFALLVAPGLWLAFRLAEGSLGAQPLNAAIHSTGYWAIWLLVGTLAVTTYKAIAGAPRILVMRRMMGRAALAYASAHLVLYAAQQNWRMWTVASEIVQRFYLTIGCIGLLGLIVLGVTSSDGWAQRLGRNWKRLHRTAYVITALGLVHYLLQLKLDVSPAILCAGAFSWLMLWRLLPCGRDRQAWPLLGISLLATALTLGYEYAWYRFGTKVDAMRVVQGEFDIAFGLQPAGQALMLGLLATAATELRRIGMTPVGRTMWFTAGVYALGGLANEAVALFTGWYMDAIIPQGLTERSLDALWVALFGILGCARWTLRDQWQRWLIDAAWVGCIAYNFTLLATGNPGVGAIVAAGLALGGILLGQRVWLASRQAALLALPVVALLAYEAAMLM